MGDAPAFEVSWRAWTLFRIRGVPVRAHWTLLFMLPYVALALSAEFRALARGPGADDAAQLFLPITWGVLLAVALFASIIVHEVGHGVVAARFGGQIQSITLMIAGGVSRFAHAPRRPLHEALVAGAGPVTSFAIGGLVYLVSTHAAAWPIDVQLALYYIAAMNVTLGVFNLVPAFPMDGGWLLRAALTARLGRRRATAIAAHVGRLAALGLGVLGVASASLMLVVVAVFIYIAAHGEAESERVHAALDGLDVSELLPATRARSPAAAPSTLPLYGVLARMTAAERLELVIVDPRGAPLGVLLASDLETLATGAHWETTLGDVAPRLPARHVVVPRELAAIDAIDRAADAGAAFVVVVGAVAGRPAEVVGLIAAEDIARTVRLQRLVRRPDASPISRPRMAS